MVVARCSLYQAPAAAAAAIDAAATRLRDAGLASEDELRASHIAFCPLAAGTGMVPTPGQLYLDDGLVGLGTAWPRSSPTSSSTSASSSASVGVNSNAVRARHAGLWRLPGSRSCAGSGSLRASDEVRERLLRADP